MTTVREDPGDGPDSGTLVVDAGALAVALADDGEDGARARTHLSGHRLVATSPTGLEVLGIWQQAVRTGALPPERAQIARQDLAELPLIPVDPAPVLDRCWHLQSDLHAHDAAALALAELIDAPLVTTQSRLAEARGTHARVVLLH